MIFEINTRRQFNLQEVEGLLPLVYRLTDETSKDVRKMMQCLDTLPDKKSERAVELEARIDSSIDRWQKKIQKLGAIPKGLWLADFDNGQGYWCWKFPETSISHQHGYKDGFSGRKLIEAAPGDLQ